MEQILRMEIKKEEALKEAQQIHSRAKEEQRSLNDEEKEKFNRAMEKVDNLDEEIRREKELAERAAQERKPDPEKDRAEWRSLGEFVRTVINNPRDKRLRGRETESRTTGEQEMDSDSAGGYLVPDQFVDEILTVDPDEALVRPRARVLQQGSDAPLHVPALKYSGNNMFAGATVSWIDEGAEKPQTDLEFKRITLNPHEVAAHVEVTDKLLRNANIIEDIVRNQLRAALLDAEEKEFLTGDGSGKPTGIIGHSATVSIDRDSSDEVKYEDLVKMYEKFRGRNGIWIANRNVLPQLMQMQDPEGHYIWQPNAREGRPAPLFGRNLYFTEHLPELDDDDGDIILVDLSQYLISDGAGIAIDASPHVKFTNNITVIKAFKTVDGKPWLEGALPDGTSPFVQLDEYEA